MQVGKLAYINFKASQNTVKTNEKPSSAATKPQELSNITPDYNIKTPQKYNKIGVDKLMNGLEVHSYKLANGHRVTIVPMKNSPTIIQNYVSVGALNETDDIKGISHFLEHMAFNGTTGENGHIKLNTGDSFKKIEELGGWTNACTSLASTDYINSTPQLDDKDVEQQIKVIAAMTEDLALTDEMIEKEKGTVCSEINMIMDRPTSIAFDQTIRSLFNIKSSADEMVAGSVNHIQNLNSKKVREYYEKYYTPDNMNLVITGDVNPDKIMEIVAKNFTSKRTNKGNRFEEPLNPISTPVRKDFISDKADKAEIILGFVGPKNNDARNRVLFEIVNQYLTETETNIIPEIKKLNADFGIGMEKVSNNPNNPTTLYIGSSCTENNSEKVLKLIYDKLSSIKTPSEEKLNIIKERMLQNKEDALDYSEDVNNIIGSSILNNTPEYYTQYKEILNSITTKDVKDFIDNYFNLDKAALTVVHPTTDIETITKNHNDAASINFKGKDRKPIDMEKIATTTLDNNYKFTTYQSNNNNIRYSIDYTYKIPNEVNKAATVVLDELYRKGTADLTEREYRNINENNNISIIPLVNRNTLKITTYSNADKFPLALEQANKLLETPRLTEELFEKAKQDIKEDIMNSKDYAIDLYSEYLSSKDPRLSTSKKDVLKGLETLTLDDVKNLHEYIKNNSYASITMNVPQDNKNIEQVGKDFSNNFKKVLPFNHKMEELYTPNLETVVLTKAENRSQADIEETFHYQKTKDPKVCATAVIMNSILSNSHSIGLFNTLREKEQLAYHVGSTLGSNENMGTLTCLIGTTTDDGNNSFDNLQKSINGFNRQINALLNSEYTDDDIEIAKRALKADLLQKEGVSSNLNAISTGIYSNRGIDYENQIYNVIDSITREDIDNFAKKVFANKPIYSIVATQDTLDFNKEYLENLKNS